MGGNLHSFGSEALKERACKEASRTKKPIANILKKCPTFGPQRIAKALNEEGFVTDRDAKSGWQRVQAHMMRNGQASSVNGTNRTGNKLELHEGRSDFAFWV